MKITGFSILYNILKNMPVSYYAVASGRVPGIYKTWDECKEQVHKFPHPIFKKFPSQAEAENFIKKKNCPNVQKKRESATHAVDESLQAQVKKSVRKKSTDSNAPPLKKAKLINIEDLPNFVHVEQKKTSGDFIVDDDGYTNVYTDGACSSNGNKNARAGIGVWFGDNHPLNVSKAVTSRATNNTAEIEAVTMAAMQAKKMGIKKLKINTDSKFLISCIKDWMPKWKANGWMTATNKPVINKTELLQMEEAIASLDIKWNHVNGHVGIHGNEMADKLAKAGCS